MCRDTPEPSQSSRVTERLRPTPTREHTRGEGWGHRWYSTWREQQASKRAYVGYVGGQSDLPIPAPSCKAVPTQEDKYALIVNIKRDPSLHVAALFCGRAVISHLFLRNGSVQTKGRQIFAIPILKRQLNAFSYEFLRAQTTALTGTITTYQQNHLHRLARSDTSTMAAAASFLLPVTPTRSPSLGTPRLPSPSASRVLHFPSLETPILKYRFFRTLLQ